MPVYLAIIWAVVFGAGVAAVYIGLGGRALFGASERPQRILGRRVQLRVLEGGPDGLERNDLPPAIVEEHTPPNEYLLRFESPFVWSGRAETEVRVSPRFVGYSISMTAGMFKRRITVNGKFTSGETFIGALSRI